MTEKELVSRLSSLDLDQLDKIQQKLNEKIEQNAQKRERLSKLPPRTSNDLEDLAELQGLDLSGLMRDVKRYS